MFTVTPIGSCRITTPLRLGQAAHGLRLNMARTYGYCHSPAEAVQMARFLRGDCEIPADLWPLVCRSHDHATLTDQAPEMSDLYVVEIASAKELTVDGVSIQLNYLRAAFPEFLSDAGRAAAFWELADAGDEAATADFLKQVWSATAEQRQEARLLARIRRSLVTRDTLRADLQRLAALLPDILVVTHVNAVKPDGQPIRSRAALIAMVAEECAALGLPCCDPTDLMVEFGQPRAIEDDSTSLAHFTEDFARALVADWMRTAIAPRTDALVRPRPEALAAQIEAAVEAGDLQGACARLARIMPDLPALDDLRADLRQAREALGAPGEDLAGWLRRAGELGCFDRAAEAMRGADALPCDLLTTLALAASQAGDAQNAATFALAALDSRPDAPRAADVLAGLVVDHGLSLADRPEALAAVRPRLGAERIARALGHAAFCLPSLIAPDMPAATMARVAEIAGPAAAPALAFWREAQAMDRIRDVAVAAALDDWVEQAEALEQPLDRARALARIALADPMNADLRRALRDARRDLVARIRACGKARDLASLQGLAPEVLALPDTRPEFDLWRARLLLAADRPAEAAAAGLAATRAMPERLTLWVLVMRAARQAGDRPLALTAADRVEALAADAHPALTAEAQKLRDAVAAAA